MCPFYCSLIRGHPYIMQNSPWFTNSSSDALNATPRHHTIYALTSGYMDYMFYWKEPNGTCAYTANNSLCVYNPFV